MPDRGVAFGTVRDGVGLLSVKAVRKGSSRLCKCSFCLVHDVPTGLNRLLEVLALTADQLTDLFEDRSCIRLEPRQRTPIPHERTYVANGRPAYHHTLA